MRPVMGTRSTFSQ